MTTTNDPAGRARVAAEAAGDACDMAILVNSSDGFRDCWFPFFRLFEIHWPNCRFPIYLNVESASYEHPSLAVRCLNHPPGAAGRKMPWSDRLLASLGAIPQRHVLYMQEDYFLDAAVRDDLVEEALRLVARERLGCLHLTPFGARRGRRAA
ncbi:MAG: hypothetical protein EBZ59_03280, partial [Planctomycetia bacterium]|nr:hypothetical protein [Planctomycetia bacterium]